MGSRLALFVSSVALLVAAPASPARTYKWVDEHGTTHYSQHKPPGRSAEVVTVNAGSRTDSNAGDDCSSLACRAARLTSERREREQAAAENREQAARKAASYPVFSTPVEETDEEKIARLVAQCKSRRGTDCDSDAEKRRMLLRNVDLTHAERRALRRFPPTVQRRFLLRRIPERYRNVE